jgi:autotransporter-associated beta strand protein
MTFSGGITGARALTLANNGARVNGITISGAALNNGGSITNAGTFEGSVLISSVIGANVTGLTQNSATSSLSLSGANLFTGNTVVTAGALSYLNTAARSSTLTTVAANSTLGLGISGTNAFTAANVDSLFQGTLSGVTNNATSNVGIDTSGGDASYTTTGAATTRGLAKMGTNTLDLTITPGTYSGPTSVLGGTLALAGNNSATSSNISVLASGALSVTDANSFTTGTLTLAGNATNNATLNLLNDTGTNFAKDVILAGTAINSLHTINVDRAIGGAGSDQPHTIGTITSTGAVARTLNVNGANGYTLNIGSLVLNSGNGQNTTINGNVNTTIDSVVNPMSGYAFGNFDTLTLSGTAAGNTVSGVIADATGLNSGGLAASDANGGLTRVTKTGTGTWTLNNANTYAGITSISAGTLNVNTLNSVAGGSASSTLGAPTTVANGTINIGSGASAGTLNYTGSGETTDRVLNLAGTTGGATITQSGSGLLRFTSALTATGANDKILNLNGSTTGNGQLDGPVVNNSAANITVLGKNGTNTWRLNAVNTYTGNTNINGGTLALGANGTTGATLAASAVTVNSGGTLAVTPGVATTANNSIGSSLTLNAGSAFSADDGFNNTFSVTGALNLYSGTAGVAPTYSFNVSGTDTVSDRIASAGLASFTNAGALISIVPTAALTTGHSFTLATATSGLDSGNAWTLANAGRTAFGNTAYTLSLANNPDSSVVSVTGSGAAFAYYTGDQGGGLNTNNAGNTNWATDVGGLTDAADQPNALSDVFFSATGASNLTIADLGQNYVVNSLNFNNAAGAVSISDSGAFGITVNGGVNSSAGAPAASINVPVTLGGTQSWTNNSSNSLSFNNAVTLGSSQLSVEGTGDTVFGNTVDASSSQLFVTSSGNTSFTSGVMLGTSPLSVSASGDTAISGAISGDASVIKTDSGTLTLSGANTYTGATTVSGGTLVLSSPSSTTSNISINGGTNTTLRVTDAGATGSGILNMVTAATTPRVELHINGGGAINLANALSGNSGVITTFDVNNNGSGTNGVIAFTGSSAASAIGNATFNITGGNGYSLRIDNLRNIGGAVGTLLLNPTTASVSLGNATVNPGVTTITGSYALGLGGTATGNTVTGVISNNADGPALNSVTKSNSSTWTLSGANTYTGATAVNGGTLKNGSASTFTRKGTLTMANAGIFDLNGFDAEFTTAGANTTGNTITNDGVSDAVLRLNGNPTALSALITDGSTNKLGITLGANANSGTNVFNLASNNTFSGGILLAPGTTATPGNTTRLRVFNGTISGTPLGTREITIGETTADRAGVMFNTLTGTNTIGNEFIVNTIQGPEGTALVQQGIRVDSDAQNLSFTGKLTAGLTNVSFSGTGAATATGQIRGVTNGFQTTNSVAITLNNAAEDNNYAGDTLIQGTSSIILGRANQIPNGATAGNVNVTGTLRTNGFSETINGLTGTGMVDGFSGTSTLTVGDNNATSSFDGTIQNTAGTLALTKAGNGVLTLAGSSTYTGATAVSAGTLLVNGSLGSTSVTVGSGGTIGGTGSIAGDLFFTSGAKLDIVNINTALTVGVGGTITFGSFGFTNITGWDFANATEGTYTLLAGTADLTNVSNVGAMNAFSFGNGKSGYFENGSLQVVVIPEPSSIALLSLGGLALALRRRRA